MLVVRLDDFKMAGPPQSLAQAWAMTRSCVKIDPLEPSGLFLGVDLSSASKLYPTNARCALRCATLHVCPIPRMLTTSERRPE